MHLEIIGRSRYGNSTFLEHQILNAPGGFVFLDLHGHSAERIADTIACIYWDASGTGIGFNPLGHVPQGQHLLVAAQVVYATTSNRWITTAHRRIDGYIGIAEGKVPNEFHLSRVVTFPKKTA
jgi:hypothetical protein